MREDVQKWVAAGGVIGEPDDLTDDVKSTQNMAVISTIETQKTLSALKKTVESMEDGTQKTAMLAIITLLEGE